MDFVSDSIATGRKLRVLTVLDDFTRECLATENDASLSDWRVWTRVLLLRPTCGPLLRGFACRDPALSDP